MALLKFFVAMLISLSAGCHGKPQHLLTSMQLSSQEPYARVSLSLTTTKKHQIGPIHETKNIAENQTGLNVLFVVYRPLCFSVIFLVLCIFFVFVFFSV